MTKYYYPEERIAVVAMGGYFPDADNLTILWDNILKKKVSIKDLPKEILDPDIFYRSGLYGKAKKDDKTYTKVAALTQFSNYLPLCIKYKIPPTVAEQMDMNQHAAIYCVDQALQSLKSILPRERTAVILGTVGQGKHYNNIIRRLSFHTVENYIRNKSNLNQKITQNNLEQFISNLAGETIKNTIPITEDSAPGTLQSIAAARISNIFDFHGPSYTLDAACASSLVAAKLAINSLLNHEVDAVITGGVEFSEDEFPYMIFSGINALSPDGSYPFDERANGFVIGYGGGVLILKRLQDAIRDGDNIIALMSGAGQCSDGKGKAIAAPSEEGQVRAIQEAFNMAGYPIDTVEMIEAHGTGTQVGDVVEINALKKAFQGLGASRENYCGVGSIKSNIGHLRYASGAPSMIKTALALQNRILPPTANIQKINPKLQLEGSPFYILTQQKYWQESNDYPRRAGVSSYGFGGADCHIAMEEYRPEFLKKIYSMSSAPKAYKYDSSLSSSIKAQEVVFFSGDSLEDIRLSCLKFINNQDDNLDYRKSVFLNNLEVSAKKEWRVAISAKSYEELKEKSDLLIGVLSEGKMENIDALQLKGIYFGKGEAVQSDKMVWVFPGQASQYPNMLKGIHNQYTSVEAFCMQVDAIWNSKYGYPVTALLFGEDEDQLQKKLKDTKNTHPAMFLSNIAMYKVLSESGVKADYMIGHSLGEITALYAAGMLDLKSAIELVGARGFSFDEIPASKRGGMVSVKADKVKTTSMIEASGAKVSVANINSGEQIVVGGSDEEIEKFIEHLKSNNIIYSVLNVSHAFHTELTLKAAESFYNKISKIKFSVPQAKVMACHKLDFYPDEVAQLNDMAQLLKTQIISPVNFSEAVMKLYDKGVRVFIESGPSSVLTNLIKTILSGKDVKVIAANSRKKDDVEAYKNALAELFTCGVDICSLPQKDMLGVTESKTITIETSKDNSSTIDAQANVQLLPAQKNKVAAAKESVVYSGVSIGLPGTFKKVFSDDNFKLLLEGKNLIELLTDDERQDMLNLNITRLLKTEGGSAYKRLSTLNEVIQLAGKLGNIDMINDYMLDEKMIRQMAFNTCAGVAAGYEALKDAGIPLVQEQIKTASGRYLPGRYVLPKEMQDDTGIIYSNGFETVEPVIEEASRFIASKFGAKTRQDLIRFYGDIITRISDPGAKKILSDWFSLHYSRIRGNSGEEDIYKFNHDFMAKICSRANNRLAQLIGAGGPNLYVSAACSSTASSVTLAEDMIRGGHASRIIVVGAENATSKIVMPFVGACFLSNGSATDSSNVFESAVPFDNRRNGMILGAGAVGLVIEKECDVAKRGMNGICRIMGTHLFNTAGHQVKIDNVRFGVELDKFMTKMEREYDFDRRSIASKTVYSSHETYSPKKGGCAMTEKEALEGAFGKHFTDLKVINTKGMTGHTLGVSIEEAVAAKSLQYQQIPPIANYREPDIELEGLNLSKGGAYNFDYVIRMVSGYGGQGNYHLLKKIASGDDRICDNKTYQDWLNQITSSSFGRLKNIGRLLVAVGDGAVSDNFAGSTDMQVLSSREENVSTYTGVHLGNETANKAVNQATNKATNDVANKVTNDTHNEFSASLVEQIVMGLISEVTKYPVEMLDSDMEMEADLGIDTVKQATIFAMLGEKFGLEENKIVNASQYRTIREIIELMKSNTDNMINSNEIGNVINTNNSSDKSKTSEASKAESENSTSGEKAFMQEAMGENKAVSSTSNIEQTVMELISEVTKYPVDMLDSDMEMEADLGIDTVKQATIFAMLGEKFGLEENKIVNASQYRTIREIIELMKSNTDNMINSNDIGNMINSNDIGNMINSNDIGNVINTNNTSDKSKTSEVQLNITQSAREASKAESQNSTSGEKAFLQVAMGENKAVSSTSNIEQTVMELISEVTKYPVEMLDRDMEMEADLGIDTVKQATILSMLGEKFGLEENKIVNASQHRTIGNLIDMLGEVAGKDQKESYGKQAVSDSYIESAIKDTNTDEADEIEEIERELSFQVPVFTEESIGVQDFELKDKNIWILGNEEQTVQSTVEKFRYLSAKIEGFIFDGSLPPEELNAKAAEFVKNPVDVIIDCSYIDNKFQFDKLSKAEIEEMLYLCSEARFIFYKKLSEKVDEPKIRITCLISADGCHGYSKIEQLVQEPFFGAISGFYKGLNKEWSKSSVKIIDIGVKETPGIPDQLLSNIVEEIQEKSVNCEIGYKNGKRMVFKLDVVDKALCGEYKLLENPHFLISGGGNGITAEIVSKLACRYKAKFTILGRTQLPADIEELAALSQEEREKKRTEIYESFKVSGKKINPVTVQYEFDKLLKAISVFRLIENVKKSGSKILYITCDISDGENVKKAVQKAILENGPVQVLIHGAGIEKSRLINQKTEEEFKEVFSVKALGLCNLYKSIDESELKAIIGFSSISGRFGNEAQLDYCAANSFINSFMAMLKSTNPKMHALSIAWSGWKDIGMAWANEFVKNNAEQMGIHLIEPNRGSEAFIRMLNCQIGTNEVIISKGVAPFIHENMMLGVKEKPLFIDWFTKNNHNFEKIYKIFSIKRDQIIDHHRIGTTPLIPAVAFMEICAEFHSLNYGRRDQYCYKNIKLKNPLKLYNEKQREAMMVVSRSTESEGFMFNTYGSLESKIGIVKQVSLNSMEVSPKLGDYSSLMELKNLYEESMEKRYAKDDMDKDRDTLKNTINLGSLFIDKEKESSIYYFNKNSAVYSVKLPKDQINNPRYPLDKLLVNPAFMDTLYQVCGFHSVYSSKRVFLPWLVEEFGVVKAPRESGEYKAYAKLKEQKEEFRCYDVIMFNERDEVCYYAKNVIMRRVSL